MKRTSRRLLVPLTLLALVAAGCGSDSNDAAGTTAAPATEAAATTAAATTERGDDRRPRPPRPSPATSRCSRPRRSPTRSTRWARRSPRPTPTPRRRSASTPRRRSCSRSPRALRPTSSPRPTPRTWTSSPPPASTAPSRSIFATNLLQIIVAPGNPKGITGVADLANPDLKVVLCAAGGARAGRTPSRSSTRPASTVTPVSLEQNVKGVVTKVTAGEADAGIVYVTDVTAAGTQGRRRRHPRRHQRRRPVPDRHREDLDEPGRRPGVHRLPPRRLTARRSWRSTASARRDHHGAGPAGRRPPQGRPGAAAAPGPDPGHHRHRLLRAAVRRAAVEGAVGRRVVDPHVAQLAHRAAPVAVLLDCGRPALAVLFGVPLAWLLARVVVPGPGAGAGAVHAVDGAAAGRRRRRPLLRARPPRPGRPVPRPVVRHHAAVHDLAG